MAKGKLLAPNTTTGPIGIITRRTSGFGSGWRGLFFLLPVMGTIAWLSVPFLVQMYVSGEMSSNAGGLIRWPVMATIPLGLGLLILQAVSEIIKRVGWLMHVHDMDTHYERPLQ